MPSRLVIVSGPPGAGKSTLARRLAQSWPAAAALHVHSDDAWTYFVKGFIPPWKPESHDQNLVVVRAMAAQGAALARGYPVLFDGLIGPWLVEHFRDAALQQEVRLDYLILRPDRATTIARGVAREGHPMRDPEVIGQMWDQFAELGGMEGHVLDVSRLTISQVSQTAMAALEGDGLRLA